VTRPGKRASAPRKIGCVQHDCADCTKLLAVAQLADELTNAIDLAEEDIGGARPIKTILGELGPAVDAAMPLIKRLKKLRRAAKRHAQVNSEERR
jgi:hypothetical protein